MNVCIVGAGMSGLAAARALKAAGHQPVIFEKNDHVGGRIATRRIGDYVFDSGASDLVPRGHALEPVMLKELDTSDLIKIEKPLFMHASLRPILPEGRIGPERYTYRTGNNRLPELLAADLDVRLNQQIESLEKTSSGGYKVLDQEYDAVILTPPIPQTATILWTVGESRPFANARYRPCLSIMLGFALQLKETHYHALLDPEQRHPLMWLSLESVKSPNRAPEGHTAMVVQLSPSYSLANFGAPEERIIGDTLDYITFLYGKEWDKPEVSMVKRWKYSQPDSVALFDTVNEPGQKLIVTGDGVVAGRAENAYDSGLKAAALLIGAGALEAAG